jgi:DNA-directed RNA polymerase subunit M/transcription elongation factor TFIIS
MATTVSKLYDWSAVRERILAMPNGEWILKQAEHDLESLTLEEYVNERLDTGRVAFEHPMFDKVASDQRERDAYILNPFEVEEGVITCGNCGGNRVFSTAVQTRAADEPMSTACHCVTCKKRWTQNC